MIEKVVGFEKVFWW